MNPGSFDGCTFIGDAKAKALDGNGVPPSKFIEFVAAS
jgi:hypothetical protein